VTDRTQTSTYGLGALGQGAIQFALRERTFLILIAVLFFLCGATYPIPHIAMWVGFAVAGYSAVANDSIQTIGTFITSNRRQKWWVLWLFIGGIFLATMTYSWVVYDGDVSFARLRSKGFDTTPTSFNFIQIAAPVFLLILTRLRMPVSTTFLLLSTFAGGASSLGGVLMKSFNGYILAFIVAIVMWLSVSRLLERSFRRDPHPLWMPAQWVTSGILWCVWLQQDAANIAVFLPRSLDTPQFLGFVLPVFFGLGALFYMGGDKVQEVIDEKSSVQDVRAATVIDLVYAVILYYFQVVSQVPMSTTWVFVGLLAGREIAMAIRQVSGRTVRDALALAGKDLVYVTIGLLVSIVLALAGNETLRAQVLGS